MYKRIIVLLLMVAMIFSCVGCTNKEKAENGKDVLEEHIASQVTEDNIAVQLVNNLLDKVDDTEHNETTVGSEDEEESASTPSIIYGPIVNYKDGSHKEVGIQTVCVDGKYGYQNTNGSMIVEPKYSFAHDFVSCNGRYFTNDGVYAIAVVEQEKDGEVYYGLISDSGTELIEPKYKTSLLGFYKHDFVPIRYSENGETLYKYIDVFGGNAAYRDTMYTSVLFQSEYVYASEFDDNGLAIAAWEVHTLRSSYITWNLIEDKLGNTVGCYFSADKISKYDDMYYLVENEGLFGLCDTKGQLVTEIIYESPESIVIE